MLISKTAPRGGFESKLLIPGMLMVKDIPICSILLKFYRRVSSLWLPQPILTSCEEPSQEADWPR